MAAFLGAVFVITAIASLVATALSIHAAITTAAHEKQQEYNQRFEQLVNDLKILAAFVGLPQQSRAKWGQTAGRGRRQG